MYFDKGVYSLTPIRRRLTTETPYQDLDNIQKNHKLFQRTPSVILKKPENMDILADLKLPPVISVARLTPLKKFEIEPQSTKIKKRIH